MLKADYHIHSNFSTDSKSTLPEIINHALSLGLEEIVITDHIDFLNDTLEPYFPFDLKAYAAAVLEMRERYAKRIIIKLGLEVGFDIGMARKLKNLIDSIPFDFIIGSTHDICGTPIFEDKFYEGKSKKEAYDEYFKSVLEVVEACPAYSVYGHLDYIERYGRYPDKAVYYNEHEEVIEEILKALIRTGKGIEVNTSGYRYGLGHATPQPLVLKRYRELGGELITVGSDAHRVQDIGTGFKEAREMLLSLGFKYVARFDGMKARYEGII